MMEEDEINLGEILDTLYFQRFLIAKVTGAFALVGLLYIIFATPIYRSDLMIQIESSGDATPTALSNISTLFGGKSEADAEMQILSSRLVVSRAVDDLHLDIKAEPHYFPLIGKWLASLNQELSNPGVFGLGGYAWGSEKIELGKFTVPADWEDKRISLVSETDDRYLLKGGSIPEGTEGKVGKTLKITVHPSGMQGLLDDVLNVKPRDEVIELRVDELDANPGTRFDLIHYSNQKTTADLQNDLNIAERVKQSDILQVKLEGDDPQKIADVLNDIGTQYVLQNIERKSAEADKTLHFLDHYLPNLKSKLNALESRTVAMKAAHGMIDETEEAKAILQRLVDAKNRAIELRAKRDELLSRYTSAYPAVQAVDAQIVALQGEIFRINAEIRKMPAQERTVLEQERDVKVDTDTYTSLLATAQQLRLMKEGSIGNVRIIDNAEVAEKPVKPKRLLIFVLSILAGMLSGTLAVIVRKHLFGGVESAHEIEEHTGLSVLATVPMSERQQALYKEMQEKKQGMYVLGQVDADDAAIESLRSFTTALLFSMQDAPNNLLMISGAAPGVGKSFISVNTAAVLAASGKRVLLLDLDLRKGHLNQYLGLPRENGITEMLVDDRPFDQVVHREILTGMDFLSTGVLPPSPHLLLVHGNLKRFLNEISADYDLVVLDTAPVLAVADAIMLSEHVGTKILVAREGITGLGELNETVNRFTHAGAKVTGVVLNAMRPRHGKYGYGDGKYRYTSHAYDQYRSIGQGGKT